MAWYKVTIPSTECGLGGKGQRLHDSFAVLLVANAGLPWDAAMFSRDSDDLKEVTYYFSPSAIKIAKLLIESHGAVSCSAPQRGTVHLAVGDARAPEMLWPQASQNS